MTLASTIGRDRPDTGAPLTVVADDARLASEARWSSETELTAAVARTRDGRRVRLGLGSELVVSWSDLGEVRSRRYRVADVVGGGDPLWRLRPLAPAEAGNRRLAPRADLVVPVGVHGPDGLVVGTSIDLSVSGARLAFAAEGPESAARRLPADGEVARLVLVLADTRVEVDAEIVRTSSQAGGARELRAAFTGLDDATRTVLRSAVGRLLDAPVS